MPAGGITAAELEAQLKVTSLLDKYSTGPNFVVFDYGSKTELNVRTIWKSLPSVWLKIWQK